MHEKTLLNIIKYSPIFLILTLSTIFTYLFIYQQNLKFKEEISIAQDIYIKNNKKRVIEEVQRVINFISFERKRLNKNSEQELKERVIEYVNSIRYGENNYIFVSDMEGQILAHYKKEFIGQNRINIKNKEGRYLLKELIDFTRQEKQGFISYKATINTTDLIQNDKISYVQYYKDWDWMVGTGFYLGELNKQINIQKELLTKSKEDAKAFIILISVSFTLFCIFISFYISRIIEKIFYNYKLEIKNESLKIVEQEKLLIQQSKMAIMGEMMGNIAHQWKQPLSLISMSNGLIQLYEEDNSFVTKKEIKESTENIENSVHYLSQTIDDFRNFFKPSKTKTIFNSNSMLEKTLKLINTQFTHNNITIIKDIKDIEIECYENELLQVLINILKNAKDELVSKESTEDKLIFISLYKECDKTTIKIKDNAGGIPEDILPNIFDAYFTTKDEEGTGIGLYMSKQIINGFGGEIYVSNITYEYKECSYTGAEFSIVF